MLEALPVPIKHAAKTLAGILFNPFHTHGLGYGQQETQDHPKREEGSGLDAGAGETHVDASVGEALELIPGVAFFLSAGNIGERS